MRSPSGKPWPWCRRMQDLHVAGFELGAQIGQVLELEVVLECERLDLLVGDRAPLLRFVEGGGERCFRRMPSGVSRPFVL